MTFDPVRLPDDLDYLMRPVRARLCRLVDLQDGTYDLADVALMNDALDVEAENRLRYQDAAAKK